MKASASIDILTELTILLDSVDVNGYSEVIDDEAVFPYVTYTLDNSFSDGEATEVFFLYIDGWDSFNDPESNGTIRLEEMMQDVASVLEQHTKSLTGASLRFILDGRKSIYEPDASIRRRKYTYQVRYVGKE